jgi:hypothetical protein
MNGNGIWSDKPITTVIHHLPINTSSQDTTLALHELGYDVISIKQMTTKHHLMFQ